MQVRNLVMLIVCILIMYGCSADVNPTRCEINVKQGNVNIPCETGYFDFGNIPLGFSQEITFTIENTGCDDLHLLNQPTVSISGANVDDFIISSYTTLRVIAPETSTTFLIKFQPTKLGNRKATIEIRNDDRDEDPYVFMIIGNCTQPAPEIHLRQDTNDIMNNSGSYDFGLVNVNDSSELTIFTIENNGNEDLKLIGNPAKVSISGMDSTMFNVDEISTQDLIQSGDETTFTIKFSPSSPGIKTAKISILNDDSDENPYTFTLYGTGVAVPEIVVKQDTTDITSGSWTYDFENILINESSSDVIFTIENVGTAALHLSDASDCVKIIGADPTMFSVNQSSIKETLQPGESTTFSLKFSPTLSGQKSATISIANNDEDENPFTFTVKGNSVEPEINVKQGTTNIPSTTGSYDFGIVYIGNSSSDITFTIENFGVGDLKLTGSPKIEVSGTDSAMFIINQSATTSPIAYNSSTTFTIKFVPTSDGNKSATISIANNDTNENPYTFTITGECQIPAPEINVKIVYNDIPNSSGSFNFENIYLGSSKDRLFTIQNLGSANLNLTGNPIVDIYGPDAGIFIVKNMPTSPIAPGNSKNFTIYCTPTTPGNKSATVSIANDDSDENPYTFTILCNAVLSYPEINIRIQSGDIPCTTGSFDFKTFRVGYSSDKQVFTIENKGHARLDLTTNPVVLISGSNASSFIINQTMTDSHINPGQTTTFEIKFIPQSLGLNTAIISIANNDSDENPFTFTVTGTGVNYISGGAIAWIGGGSNGWKITDGTNSALDYKSFYKPTGVFVDSAGFIYVVDKRNHRVCKWDSAGNAIGWIGGGSNGWKTGTAPSWGTDYQSFLYPQSVFVDSSGYIYVADTQNERISKWDSAGNAIGWIGGSSNGWKTGTAPSSHSGDYQSFKQPYGVYIDSNGYIYVADGGGYRVCKWDSSGNAIGWIGGGSNGWKTSNAPSNDGQDYQSFRGPIDVELDSAGNIFVCDSGNHRVCKWSSSGSAIGWIGGDSNGWKTGNAPSNSSVKYQGFSNPNGMHISSSGYLYIADTQNCRICKWDSSGNAIGWIGCGSNGWKTSNAAPYSYYDYQNFGDPTGVFVDSAGFIFVADSTYNRICKWED